MINMCYSRFHTLPWVVMIVQAQLYSSVRWPLPLCIRNVIRYDDVFTAYITCILLLIEIVLYCSTCLLIHTSWHYLDKKKKHNKLVEKRTFDIHESCHDVITAPVMSALIPGLGYCLCRVSVNLLFVSLGFGFSVLSSENLLHYHIQKTQYHTSSLQIHHNPDRDKDE